MAPSKIEWTDVTWNPMTGCSKISPGCKNCYAERMAARLQAMGQPRYANGFKPTFHPDALGEPLNWKKPRMAFVGSMTDLLHEDFTDEQIGSVFSVIALCALMKRGHIFQVLTKRPERLAELLLRYREEHPSTPWPLPNLWLGTSAEDQQRADERIPHLLAVPAAVRFLSCEPLLGPVDLLGWGEQAQGKMDVPATWAEFQWPDWMPPKVRRELELWNLDKDGHGPRDWSRHFGAKYYPSILLMPAFGAMVTASFDLGNENGRWVDRLNKMPTFDRQTITGRFVFLGGNIGRIVTDTGEVFCCSTDSGSGWLSRYHPLSRWRGLDLVIAGGESGPHARPMHPDWARSLRDQCAEARVPFFFKQWGEWVSEDQSPEDIILPSESFLPWSTLDNDGDLTGDMTSVYRVGKKAAGRLLDGIEHNELPPSPAEVGR